MCITDGGSQEAALFSRFLIFLVSKGGIGGEEGGEGQHHSSREAICSALCFIFNIKREDSAGLFGQTHRKVMGSESSVNQPKETGFDSAMFLLNCLPGALFGVQS